MFIYMNFNETAGLSNFKLYFSQTCRIEKKKFRYINFDKIAKSNKFISYFVSYDK